MKSYNLQSKQLDDERLMSVIAMFYHTKWEIYLKLSMALKYVRHIQYTFFFNVFCWFWTLLMIYKPHRILYLLLKNPSEFCFLLYGLGLWILTLKTLLLRFMLKGHDRAQSFVLTLTL